MEYLVRQTGRGRLGHDRQLSGQHALVDRGDRRAAGRACRPTSSRSWSATRQPGPGTTPSTPRPSTSSTDATCAGWCRSPSPWRASFAKLDRNPQVYRTMNGPTEFHVVGTLQGLGHPPRLRDRRRSRSSSRAGATTRRRPVQMAAIAESSIPQAEWVIFEESGHLAHAEEPDRYMAVLADFLARAEAGVARDARGGPPRPVRRELPRSAGPGADRPRGAGMTR